MVKAFEGSAEFNNLISGEGNLCVSQVLHKTFIEFTEEGTKAAAVTAVSVSRSATAKKPFEMRLLRPFLFFIRHKETSALLFSSFIQTLL